MHIERNQNSLKETFARVGLKAVLFDLDDTLIFTHEIFDKHIQEFAKTVSERLKIDQDTLYQMTHKANRDVFAIAKVNPSRWNHVVEFLIEDLGPQSEKVLREAEEIFEKIYEEVPRLQEGSVETLQTFANCNIPMSLVTHANADWTNFKLNTLTIRPFFSHIFIISENKIKEPVDWQKAISTLDLSPHEVIVIGDNKEGDILASHQIGVQRLVWINSQTAWAYYQKGTLPEGVMVISKVNELINCLLTNL